jgi:hypothetical protein
VWRAESRRSRLRIAWLAAVALAWAVTFALTACDAFAATPVAVQLVLSVDVSGSVSQDRFELQRQGYAAAFRDAQVLQAIQSTSTGSIAVAMVQWTGPSLHVVAVDWTLVSDAATAARLATAIEAAPRALFGGGTSISGAIDYARDMLARAPFQGERRVIDVSGDGSNNRGRPAEDARDDAVRVGVAINGLPILTIEPDLDEYYRRNVIGGPGAFVIAVRRYEDFAATVRKKLITEIAGIPSREHAVDIGLHEVGVGVREIGERHLLDLWHGRVLLDHAGNHGFDMLQMLDGASDALAGDILERAGLEDGVHLFGEGRRIAAGLEPRADGLGGTHDLVGGVLGGLNHCLQLDTAVVRGRDRWRDHVGDLLMDRGELLGKIGLAVVDELHRGMDLHAQFGDPAIDEFAQVVAFRADGGAHEFFEAVGHGVI